MNSIKNTDIITIFGGEEITLGYLINKLAKTGAKINFIQPNDKLKNKYTLCGFPGQITCIKSNDQDALIAKIIKNSTHIINLVNIFHETKRQNYIDAHEILPEKIARYCHQYKIKKFIHVSTLGIDKIKNSNYCKTRLVGEKNVLREYPNTIIIRPSIAFGEKTGIFHLLHQIIKFSLFIPITNSNTKLQPIYAGDIANAINYCTETESENYFGKVLEIAGPEVITLKQIVKQLLQISNTKRIIINIPHSIAKLMLLPLRFWPKPIFTSDQLDLLKHSNTLTKENFLNEAAIKPSFLNMKLKKYR